MLRLPNLAWVCFRTEACDGHLLNPTSSRRASRRLGHGQQYESPVRRHLGEACPQVEDSPRRKILEAISARWPLLAGTASTWLLMNMCGAWTCRLSLPSMHVIKSRRVCRLSFAIAPLVECDMNMPRFAYSLGSFKSTIFDAVIHTGSLPPTEEAFVQSGCQTFSRRSVKHRSYSLKVFQHARFAAITQPGGRRKLELTS